MANTPDHGPSQASSSPALASMLAEHADIEKALADPAVHTDQARARALGRRYAELTQVAEVARDLATTRDDWGAANELAADDASFAAEAETLATREQELAERLQELLLPRDPDDVKDAILEIKAGEGGEESALFAGDLMRMYLRFAEQSGWSAEVLDATESDLGGYKDISIAIRSKTGGVYGRLKYEAGVHRVQRVPVTESQGRLHTSAAGVHVLPEAEDVDVDVNPNDLRIDVFRSSGPGGQSVNTTDSAVRITHLPTGTVVSCQNEKSQLQNKESALRILRARLLAHAREVAAEAAGASRAAQVRTVDRSERVRTYNFKENRISDHRVGYTAYNLDRVLDGELGPLLDILHRAEMDRLLAEVGTSDVGKSARS
ncbi:MAG: prfA [Mycobacterium sp.]|nr:prfA [Mycobacterium sp.]